MIVMVVFYLSILLFSLTKSLMKYVYVSLWTPHRILVTVYSDFDRGVNSLLNSKLNYSKLHTRIYLIVVYDNYLNLQTLHLKSGKITR